MNQSFKGATKRIVGGVFAVSVLGVPVLLCLSAVKARRAPAATSATAQIVEATTTFLKSLDAEQRKKVQFPYTLQKTATAARFARSVGPGRGPGGEPPGMPGQPSGQRPGDGGPGGPGSRGQRGGPGGGGPPGGFSFIGEQYGQAVWSNFPVSDVPRPGLQFGSLSAAQRDAAMHLLKVVLSAQGYQKVIDSMGADQVLADGGTNYASGTDVYTIGIFGTPSTTKPWMLQFGGHHLGLNVTIAGEKGVITPTLTGAQPALYTRNGKTVRPLGRESDKALALLNALDDTQRKQAILNYRIDDLVVGPGRAGDMAHASHETVLGALKASTKPILISHTSLDSRTGNNPRMAQMMKPRLISKEHAKAVADAGGVVGVWTKLADSLPEFVQSVKAMVDAIGIDHVGLGTDTDLLSARVGAGTNRAYFNMMGGFFPAVVGEMLHQGFTLNEIVKVGGGNYCRVFDKATSVRA